MITLFLIKVSINIQLEKQRMCKLFINKHINELFVQLRQTNSVFRSTFLNEKSVDNKTSKSRPKTAVRPKTGKITNRREMMLNNQLKLTSGGSQLNTLVGPIKTTHEDSSMKQMRGSTNTFMNAEKYIYAKGILKPKVTAISKERPRTQVHTKIGNYINMETKPEYNESNMLVLKDLFNAFTSSKVNSRLAAYNQANTMHNKTRKSIGPYPYSLTEKKEKKEKSIISPVKVSRFTLKDIPTQTIVKHMEQRKMNESKSQDLSVSAKPKRPAIIEASYKSLEDFAVEAEKIKNEVKPLLKRSIIFEGRYDDGKKSGKGDFLYPNKDFYRGNFDRDSKEGFGIFVSFSQNFIYKGEFKNDQIKGPGICLMANGMIVEGFYNGSENLMNDTDVKCLYLNGELYEGRWKFNKRHGKGKHIYLDYTIYDGDWVEDRRNGNGKMTQNDGSFIHGEFKNDRMIGATKFIDSNRNVYEPVSSGSNSGRFVNGRLYGQGKILFINGDVYEGQFKDGKRCGQGKIQYKSIKKYHDSDEDMVSQGSNKEQELDWAVYDGNWNDNCRHGYGMMKWSDGSVFKGDWKKDQRFYGTMLMVTGIEYTGFWKNDKFHGKGVLKLDEGITFDGEFVNGHRKKYGKLIYPDKSVYIGEMDNTTRQGHGRLEENGNVFEGFFEDNKK